ncbi:MAG TPA: glycoside hydrolase family 15 protein [Streptosporangiaceae bacterium]|nr:glycoside hydrolase family 15 protein [Streptosporangiaceae bacterium]
MARKDCLGTAAGQGCKVWYTVAGGVLSDVYEPTIDNTDVSTLQYIVTDGSTFTDLQSRDMTYTAAADPTGMACTVTSTDARHGYRLVTTYITDPARDTVLMHTSLQALPGSGVSLAGLHLYARLDAHVNGNGGGGSANVGANSGTVDDSGVPVVFSTNTVTNAANRDYAVPTYMALASTPQGTASVGYAGSASDGLTQLDSARALTPYTSAPDGHIVATENVTPGASRQVTLALGFGRSQAQSVSVARSSLSRPFALTAASYLAGWAGYDARLRPPPARELKLASHYYLSANVLKASEDKTFPGAIVASLASPWGQSVPAGVTSDGEPSYFGSYREVFARDLYEAFTGLMADGDVAAARAATLFLFDRQQLPDGAMPRNSLLNGKAAPDTGGTQMDEAAYPILMAYLAGLGGDASLYQDHIRPAADFLVTNGPSDGVERWEEQTGYSPSTIAAEIAGLTAASAIAASHGDATRARLYQATADDFQRNIKAWTVTTTGPDGPRYFIRLSKTGDPNAAISYSLGNGGPTLDQRSVIDGGFQELVRLGELPVSDLYVHGPGAASTSTNAAFASRNYQIAPSGAWSQRIEVQGFASPVWVNAGGTSVGTASVLAEQADRTITIALPEAQFGTPSSGWGFSVVLTGQDGFGTDQARDFTATAGGFTFGVCAPGGNAPICAADPATVPKAMDILTAPGVSQAAELAPASGPATIAPVTVP